MLKKLFLITLVGGALLAPGMEAGVKARQKRQGARIHQGVHDGSLTRREAKRLGYAWGNLNRQIRRDRRDGGGLTPRERVKIHRKQDRLSRQIYKQRHDGQTRNRR